MAASAARLGTLRRAGRNSTLTAMPVIANRAVKAGATGANRSSQWRQREPPAPSAGHSRVATATASTAGSPRASPRAAWMPSTSASWRGLSE